MLDVEVLDECGCGCACLRREVVDLVSGFDMIDLDVDGDLSSDFSRVKSTQSTVISPRRQSSLGAAAGAGAGGLSGLCGSGAESGWIAMIIEYS